MISACSCSFNYNTIIVHILYKLLTNIHIFILKYFSPFYFAAVRVDLRMTLKGHSGPVTCCDYSHDGCLIASG